VYRMVFRKWVIAVAGATGVARKHRPLRRAVECGPV
jgi:hypothetical protein